MMEIVERDWCCGCGACKAICPRTAICIQKDTEGFYYPVIDSNKCIECGLCKKVCGVVNFEKVKNHPILVCGAKNKDDSIRMDSSSGGSFSAFAELVLKQNGIVYGAASVDNVIRHIRIDSNQDIYLLRGSKYVQSDIGSSFEDVISDLKAGKKVLFSGTPCQCAGLKNLLDVKKVDCTNLILIDFVCHGVCSPRVFADYIQYCNERYESPISEHKFRDKIKGWGKHTESNILQNGTKDSDSFISQMFKSVFYSSLALRPSCYNCKFTTTQRVGDITMADFWGLKRNKPDQYDETGVSLLLINTEQGKTIVKNASSLHFFDASLQDTDQPMLEHPTEKPSSRPAFWEVYMRGFDKAMIKYFHAGKIRRFFTERIKKILKR